MQPLIGGAIPCGAQLRKNSPPYEGGGWGGTKVGRRSSQFQPKPNMRLLTN